MYPSPIATPHSHIPADGLGPHLGDMSTPHGGSSWGPGTLAGGDGKRQPSEGERDFAERYGEHFGMTALALKLGRAAAAAKAGDSMM